MGCKFERKDEVKEQEAFVHSNRSLVLLRILGQAAQTNSVDESFDDVHASVGLVPSGVLVSFLQWGERYDSRTVVVCNIKEIQRFPSVFITFMAWSLIEVICYLQYALITIGLCPRWLSWLRYTAFIPLYPIGAWCGEVLLCYQALPYIKNYYNFIVARLVLCPFLWWRLYMHMLGKLTQERWHKVHKL
ncbi:hypothetical protein KP509_16G035300 [Ceratopteris richardii]|uniref:Very-long-chain (3R)-3-hydroxyacyl-CoA dehydratase n=1 Tax=Ceratopteris richardii TaxID=49495 RepID=A0A8T2T109_CERRI|nr:hypothetical protein KP509_16G035300 [Ceratopteris richardii]